jgi:uncharacterized membrane protein YccC
MVLIGLLALWIAFNAGATHLLRGVHGYAALLAGMTAAIVVIPSLVAPSAAMPIALARVECTLIGVIVASLVMAFQTPEAPLAEFYHEVRALSSQAVTYAIQVLRGDPLDDGREERRILGHISQLELSARLQAAGSMAGYRRQGDVDLLVVGTLATMAAARAARDARGPIGAGRLRRLEAIAEYLRVAWPLAPERTEGGPRARVAHAYSTHDSTDADPALQRLDAGIREILDADLALAQVDAPRPSLADPSPVRLAPHREWALAWREAALAAVASFGALAMALAYPQPSIGLMAMGVCIFVMVLGSMPLPQLIAPTLISGVTLGVLAAIVYRLLLQPAITTPAGLLLSVIPFMLAGGFFRTHPRFGAAGIDFSMCFLLASQAGMPATHDLPRLLQDAGALLGSAGGMAALFLLLPHRAPRQALDAATLIRRDLQRILGAATTLDRALWRARSSRQILRLALHLGRAKDLGRRWPRGLLATLNLGQAMIELQDLGMPETVKDLLTATLRQEMLPQSAVQSLSALAEGEAPGLRSLLLRLGQTLEQAQELLTFDHKPLALVPDADHQ